MSRAVLFLGLVLGGVSHAASETVDRQALAVLIKGASEAQLTGDVRDKEDLGTILVRFVLPTEVDAKTSNTCELSQDKYVCSLSYLSKYTDLTLEYSVRQDLVGLSSPSVQVTRGTL